MSAENKKIIIMGLIGFVIFLMCLILVLGTLFFFKTNNTTEQEPQEIEIQKTDIEIILEEAFRLKQQNRPYIMGQFDCSRFIQLAFAKANIILPRVSTDQYYFYIENPQIEAINYLIFFDTGWVARSPNHTGIIISDSLFIHNTSSRNVHLANFAEDGYWKGKLYNPSGLKERARGLINWGLKFLSERGGI